MRKIKKYILILFVIVLLMLSYKVIDIKVKKNYELYKSNVSNYSEMVGISIPNDSTVLEYYDTHGGLHGDGESYVIIQLTNKGQDMFINNANKSGKWDSLPLSKEIKPIIFGGEYEGIDYGDGIFEINEKIPISIKNGLYYFKDRYIENYPEYAKTDVKSRDSFNFTISLLDIDNGKLYVFEYDS